MNQVSPIVTTFPCFLCTCYLHTKEIITKTTIGNHFYKAFSLICYYQWSLLSAANPMGLPSWAVPMGYQTS